ncbi:MAG: alkaline phosphatase family protein, partial [Candidatus Sericytochromatia bacterium]
MLRTSLFAALSLAVLAPAVLAAPAADPAEAERVRDRFKEAARRSLGPRSGDLFALPNKHNYIIHEAYMAPEQSAIERNGRVEMVKHRGNHHGTAWDYDVRIPLVLYGPGHVAPGMALKAPATQQDIAPTLAHVLGVVPPEDARGRVLHEALKKAKQPPKVVLVVVFDQGGTTMYEHHPKAAPFVTSLAERGARYVNAEVTHIDPETVVGHVAIGTGAYPGETGVVANKPWVRHAGQAAMTIAGTTGATPVFIESPTLADVWLKETKNQAIVISQSLADRAAIGMVGHGAWYGKNKKPIVNFFDEKAGTW